MAECERPAQPTPPDHASALPAAPPVQTAEQGDPTAPFGGPQDYYTSPTVVKTSGLAIASLCCGVAGLFTCCTVVPSVLGIVLGVISLVPIRQGESRGRGLAIAGIATGALGLVAGMVVWVIVARSPEVLPIPGREVSAADRRAGPSLSSRS